MVTQEKPKRGGKREPVAPTHLRVGMVAQMLQICESQIHAMIRAGEFPYVRIGTLVRVPMDDLNRYLAERKVVGADDLA